MKALRLRLLFGIRGEKVTSRAGECDGGAVSASYVSVFETAKFLPLATVIAPYWALQLAAVVGVATSA